MNIRVGEIMTEDLISVYTNTLMTPVAEIFRNNRFNHIPVLDSEDKPVGIISRHNYNMAQHCFTILDHPSAHESNDQVFKSMLVDDIMTKNPVTLDVDDYLATANDLFVQKHINSIIITENEKCIGILTPTDVLIYIRVPGMVIH